MLYSITFLLTELIFSRLLKAYNRFIRRPVNIAYQAFRSLIELDKGIVFDTFKGRNRLLINDAVTDNSINRKISDTK